MKIYKIFDYVYGVDLIVIIGKWEDYQRYLKRSWDVEMEEWQYQAGQASHLIRTKDGFQTNVVWLKNFKWCVEDYAVLAHEILHSVQATVKRVKIEPDSEAVNYYFQYLFRTALRKIKKGNVKRKRSSHD